MIRRHLERKIWTKEQEHQPHNREVREKKKQMDDIIQDTSTDVTMLYWVELEISRKRQRMIQKG